MKMTCEKVQPNLLDYVKGLLSGPEAEEVKTHINHCVECKVLLEEELAFSTRLSALPIEQLVSDVWEIIQERTKPRSAWLAGFFATNLRKTVATTAAAVVLFAALYNIQPVDQKQVIKNEQRPTITLKWSDDPLGDHTDATLELIAKM